MVNPPIRLTELFECIRVWKGVLIDDQKRSFVYVISGSSGTVFLLIQVNGQLQFALQDCDMCDRIKEIRLKTSMVQTEQIRTRLPSQIRFS
jgi:hypothetical protein